MAVSLESWRETMLPRFREAAVEKPVTDRVTVLAYCFETPERFDAAFAAVEAALYQTWRCCGALATVLIVNSASETVDRFCRKHPHARIIVRPGLCPGSLASMSRDMNGNLARYFETDYALVVQNDGFPLRSGLETFLDRWDYIGAPYTRPFLPTRLLERLEPGFAVGNGGFSLRSRRLCDAANRLWQARFHRWGDSRWLAEDVYFCLTLRLFSPAYRRATRLPRRDEALAFSYDALTGERPPRCLPFGFHGARAFGLLHAAFPEM